MGDCAFRILALAVMLFQYQQDHFNDVLRNCVGVVNPNLAASLDTNTGMKFIGSQPFKLLY